MGGILSGFEERGRDSVWAWARVKKGGGGGGGARRGGVKGIEARHWADGQNRSSPTASVVKAWRPTELQLHCKAEACCKQCRRWMTYIKPSARAIRETRGILCTTTDNVSLWLIPAAQFGCWRLAPTTILWLGLLQHAMYLWLTSPVYVCSCSPTETSLMSVTSLGCSYACSRNKIYLCL